MKLEFKNVTKQYGEVNAVNKVNCVMEKGIYGRKIQSIWELTSDISVFFIHGVLQ